MPALGLLRPRARPRAISRACWMRALITTRWDRRRADGCARSTHGERLMSDSIRDVCARGHGVLAPRSRTASAVSQVGLVHGLEFHGERHRAHHGERRKERLAPLVVGRRDRCGHRDRWVGMVLPLGYVTVVEAPRCSRWPHGASRRARAAAITTGFASRERGRRFAARRRGSVGRRAVLSRRRGHSVRAAATRPWVSARPNTSVDRRRTSRTHTVVAYEGHDAVYAKLVSERKHPRSRRPACRRTTADGGSGAAAAST